MTIYVFEDEGDPPLWPWMQIMRAADANAADRLEERARALVSGTLGR